MNIRLSSGHRERALMFRCAFLGLLWAAGPLSALEPNQSIAQYAHNVWTRENGLPPAGIRAMAQTSDGWLWIGTDAGLVRFDGVRFQPWKPPSKQQLISDYINALAPARDGGLWIGSREGLSHWRDATLQNYQTNQGAAGPNVEAVLVDRAGTVWVGTVGYRTGALCRVEDNRLRCYGAADGLATQGVLSLFEDRRGDLWVGGLGLGRWKPGMPRIQPLLDPRGETYSIAEDREGAIWAAGSGLNRFSGDRMVPYPLFAANQKLQPRVLLVDRDGALWIGTWGQGLIRLYKGQIDRFTRVDGLSDDIVNCLFQDREGNIWAGTEGGLDRFREFTVTTISEREGLSHGKVTSVMAAKDGGIWSGTSGGLDRIENRGIVPYTQQSGLPSDAITGTFEEQNGRLWVSTDTGLAYSDGARFRSLHLPFRLRIWFAAAAEDRDHCVWLSVPEHGLIRFRDAHVAEVVPWSLFNNREARALEPDLQDGGLWLGFAAGGIAYYKPGQPVRWYLTAGPLAGETVADLHRMRDGSLWIATARGVGRLLNGSLSTLTTANGLPCDRIHSIVEDDKGALWLNTACGLVHISGADLTKWSASPRTNVPVRVYDAGDGMRSWPKPMGYFRRAAKSSDGRLWFAVLGGIAVVNPDHLPENRIPPPVSIERITAGRTAYSIDPNRRLPALTKELSIDYTALSFVAPGRVRFRYRLDGFDKEWNDDNGRRQAVYTNLPPKHYTFRVIACNDNGVWNNQGAFTDFSIDPAYYQTNWFRSLGLGGFAILLWSVYRLRLRKMEAVLALRFQERIAERTRIAREMHDTLLQNISGLALQLQGLAKMPTLPASAKDRLYQIRKEAEGCLREAREFLWELRSPALEERDIAETLREAGEELVSGVPVQFHTTVQGDRFSAPVKLQQQLLRIIQEATRNAIRYSRANEIEMRITYLGRDSIRVQLRDDGCGFDTEQAALKSGHWGLKTMRERANQIGAELKISSSPGHGTELEIVAPITRPPS